MEISRRSFLAATGATGTGALLGFLGLNLRPSVAYAARTRLKRGRPSTTICPYCAVGCGAIVEEVDGKVVNIEGDPDHPINLGTLCSKGNALYQIANNERRLTKVKYRAPGATEWQEKDWDWAIQKIAENIKKTRDQTFRVEDDQGRLVNRTEGIACLGGAALDNEECYAYSKLARALGIVYIEHQARI